jgi:hypothetical protein
MRSRILVALVACIAALAFPSAARAASCGNFVPVGSVTLNVGETGSYNVFAGPASFTATMNWGDGGTSVVSVAPTGPTSANLTHVFTSPGTFPVTLSVSGQLGDGTACADSVFIATATVVQPGADPVEALTLSL